MTEMKQISIGDATIGGGAPLALIAGPCVIESHDVCMRIAEQLVTWAAETGVPFVFKASYDKANRSSADSFRGPGIEEGLEILGKVRAEFNVPVVTDVHCRTDVERVAEVVDMIQLPAFLCRQTDLAVALGRCGKIVNVKKGQFMAPWDMKNVVDKIASQGAIDILITERGSSFGYNNLVADMRGIPIQQQLGYPVVFDATHSVQIPGGNGKSSGGEAQWAPYLAKAAVAAGCDAVFVETHYDPSEAKCDGENMIAIEDLKVLWPTLTRINEVIKS